MSLSRLFRRNTEDTHHDLPVLESSTIILSETYKTIMVAAAWSKPQILAHKKQAAEEHFIIGENWLRCQPWVNISNTTHYKLDDGNIAYCGLKMNFGGKYNNSHRCFLPLSSEQYNSSVGVTIATSYRRSINERGPQYYTDKYLQITVNDVPLSVVLKNHLSALTERINHPNIGYFEKKLCLSQKNKVESFLAFYLAQRTSHTLMIEPEEVEKIAELFLEEQGSNLRIYPYD